MVQPWRIGDVVRFAYQPIGHKFTITKTLLEQGQPLVELKELPGQFAVHLFVSHDYPEDSIVPRPKR